MPIDREKMLDNLSEAWSFRHDGQRHFMDSYDAIHRLILTAPETAGPNAEDIKGMVDALKDSSAMLNKVHLSAISGIDAYISTIEQIKKNDAALAPFLAGGKEPSK